MLLSCSRWPPAPCTPALPQDIIAHKKLRLVGVVGIYPANAVGDDIEVYTNEERSEVAAKFFGLRQQAEKDGPEPYCCLSDFIAPREGGLVDYLGLFANAGTAGLRGKGAAAGGAFVCMLARRAAPSAPTGYRQPTRGTRWWPTPGCALLSWHQALLAAKGPALPAGHGLMLLAPHHPLLCFAPPLRLLLQPWAWRR